MKAPREELLTLLAFHAERPLTDSETARLEKLLESSDEKLIDTYVEYMSIHGLLIWDVGAVSSEPQLPAEILLADEIQNGSPGRESRSLVAVAATIAALVVGWIFVLQTTSDVNELAHNKGNRSTTGQLPIVDSSDVDKQQEPSPELSGDDLKPLVLRNHQQSSNNTPEVASVVREADGHAGDLPDHFDDTLIAARIDEIVNDSLSENEVTASPTATDSEWLRRVYLTMTGRIPTIDETQQFLKRDSPRKRQMLIDSVLETPELSQHFAGVWTNLLVGRTPRSHVNREKLYEFLEMSFADNTPWIDTVGELITARGRNDRNGATNFLLAHLNNQATPATAVTAKLFLGEQISCVQCHDHPFAKGVTQREYWALNAFFKDTDRVSVPIADAGTRGMKELPWQLVDRVHKERMTHFETRSGRQEAVLPMYDGVTITAENNENRRNKLARLLATDSETKVARAMVNRMWAYFFGYGFTAQIDDMGPHAAVSHPKLLNLLSEAFVKSEYDLQRLMKWIACSAAWQRSSEMTEGNATDRPDHGGTPLFSRVYVRRMTPEQVYESVRVAIRSAAGITTDKKDSAVEHRRQWVQQFAHAYDTDENDESVGFDGSIAQAMVMMNDVEVSEAIRQATSAVVSGSQKRVVPVTETLDRVALAMLTRKPTSGEQRVFRSHYRKLSQQSPPSRAMFSAIEDMMWAYLNSSEFVLIH